MAARILLYYLLMLATVGYAMRRGGAPERYVAVMVLLASLATSLVPYNPVHDFRVLSVPLLMIDGVLLAGLLVVALRADRYWPLYFAAIHLLAVALHGVRAYDLTILPRVYARLGGMLAYPVLLLLVLGTWRHTRRAPESDWTPRYDSGNA